MRRVGKRGIVGEDDHPNRKRLTIVNLGFTIVAVLLPPVVSAHDTARRAVCTTVVRQHSGSCPDTVCLERGRIVWVSRCRACGSKPDNRICFVEEKDGKLLSSEQALLEGVAVSGEVLERLRQYKLDWCERGTAGANPPRGYGP